MSKIAFIYPGQGAQAVGMGKDFYEKSPLSRTIFDQASEAVNLDLRSFALKKMIFWIKQNIHRLQW